MILVCRELPLLLALNVCGVIACDTAAEERAAYAQAVCWRSAVCSASVESKTALIVRVHNASSASAEQTARALKARFREDCREIARLGFESIELHVPNAADKTASVRSGCELE